MEGSNLAVPSDDRQKRSDAPTAIAPAQAKTAAPRKKPAAQAATATAKKPATRAATTAAKKPAPRRAAAQASAGAATATPRPARKTSTANPSNAAKKPSSVEKPSSIEHNVQPERPNASPQAVVANEARPSKSIQPADGDASRNTLEPTAEAGNSIPSASPPSDASDPATPSVPDTTIAETPTDAVPGLRDHAADEIMMEDFDLDALRVRLTALQQQISAAHIPVVILFEGWHAAGKGTMLSKLVAGLDPRGYQVYPIRKPNEEERAHPLMRRYYTKLPAQGKISIFCSSWYREISNACFECKSAKKRLNQRYDEIVNLESQLVSDGALVIKFFLHISRKEQKARLKALESKKYTKWRVEKDDWQQNEHYDDFLRLYDAMIARTHFDGAQWHVLRSDNKRACTQQVYERVIEEFEKALQDRAEGSRAWDTPYLQHLETTTPLTFPDLETFDPEQALSDPYKPAVDKAQKLLEKLQNALYLRGISMVIAFEGWDAAGKGGAIRRLTSSLDARGFDVVPIAAPTPVEKSHHHLWRFWNALPSDGNIAIFDRTWYGRVLVERIEGFCSETQWMRAYEEINRFEAEVAAHGTVLVKFWLHIDKQTQLTRFEDRQNSPDKAWKITDEDWRNREKWDDYSVAVNDMLKKTHTAAAPWTVIEANNKQFARLKVLETVIHAIQTRLDSDSK